MTFLFLPCGSQAVDLLMPDESFETDGEGSRYLSNEHSDGGGDYFERHNFGSQNPYPGQGQMINSVDGSWAWALEDVDTADNPLGAGREGIVRLDDLTVAGHNNLRVTVAFAFSDQNSEFETDDTIEVQAAFDGNSGGTGGSANPTLLQGTYTTVGRFIGTGITNDGMGLDADLNGSIGGGETTRLNNTLTDFTFTISGVGGLPTTGSSLSIQIVCTIDGGNEELAFDHIRVEGDVAATDPPVLANIEVTTIDYFQGDPPTQVTHTITVSDNDSAMLQSGTVQITGGVPSEDALSAVGAGSIVVGGNGTSSLMLTGPGTLAEFQTTLRSVTYQNTNVSDPSMQQRTVTFIVNDGANPSNGESRNINVTRVLAPPQNIPYCESFETDGHAIRYLSNEHSDGGGDFFERHNFTMTNPHPSHNEAIGGSLDGDWAWASEDVDTADNPLGMGREGIVRLNDLIVTGMNNLQVTVGFAVSQPGTEWETSKFIRVQAAFDGNSGGTSLPVTTLNNGTYTTVGQFVGNGASNEGPYLDANLNGTIEIGEMTELTETMADYTFDISGVGGLPVSGNMLSLQIVVGPNAASEEVVFDNVCVSGNISTSDAPVLANIEVTPIEYLQGDPPTQVTHTITVSDNDSAMLQNGTVQISGGVPSEDALSAVGAGSIVVGGNGTSSLTLTGPGTLAEFETTLRSVTYQNTNVTDPSMQQRTVTFIVNDGTDPSNGESRNINVSRVLAPPQNIPYCESFETDGNAIRYLSNEHTDGGSDLFE